MEEPVFRIDVASGAVTRLTGNGTVRQRPSARPAAAWCSRMNSIMAPDDLYRVDARGRGRQADQRQPRPAGAARPGELREIRASRAPTTTACGASSSSRRRAPRQAADRLRRPWRAAGQLRQRLVLSLELAAVLGARLCRGQRRFPRLDRLRPGLHRQHPERLGRQAARGSASAASPSPPRRIRSSTPTTPARSAPATAAT